MRRLIPLALLGLVLTACVGAPSGAKCQQGVCVQLQVAEPVKVNEPVTLTIAVTAARDIPGLGISLFHDPDATVDNPRGLEPEIKDLVVIKSGVDWKVDARANQTIRLTRTIRFPPSQIPQSMRRIIVDASTPSLRVSDSVGILVVGAGATVYYSGTPILITRPPVPTVPPERRTPHPLIQLTPVSGPSPLPPPTRAAYP